MFYSRVLFDGVDSGTTVEFGSDQDGNIKLFVQKVDDTDTISFFSEFTLRKEHLLQAIEYLICEDWQKSDV